MKLSWVVEKEQDSFGYIVAKRPGGSDDSVSFYILRCCDRLKADSFSVIILIDTFEQCYTLCTNN